ncbi:MAG: Nif3-like dinuclear metal center hexameric protein, partial [Gordonia sp. (in: high G+C Gram-positive bacteria)]
DLLELAAVPTEGGLGRVGVLAEPVTVSAFVARAARVLRTPWGVRATGDPRRVIGSVAVCGGAGGSLLDDVRHLGADLYLTGDLRHHGVDESLRAGGPVLADAGHWATEYPWCAAAATLIGAETGLPADCHETPTDPFTIHHGTSPDGCA